MIPKCKRNNANYSELENKINNIQNTNRVNYSIYSNYVTQTGYCNCYKVNKLVFFSFNFKIENATENNNLLISGLPKCKAERFCFAVNGSEDISRKGYVTSAGELYTDGPWENSWYNATVVYPEQ